MNLRSVTGALLILCLSCAAEARDCGGTLVRVADGRTLPFSTALAEIGDAPLVAIGERHGVGKHVEAAACLLQNLDRKSPEPGKLSLVVEHIAAQKQPAIDAYRKEHPKDADGLGDALQWSNSGWPAWSVYRPLYAAAFAGGNAIYGADWQKGTPSPSQDSLVAALGSDAAPRVVTTWAGLMSEAHCGTLDEARATVFARAQAGRDLAMAGVIETVLSGGNRVMFYSGRSHSRKDISVPFIVNARTKAAGIAISLQETRIGKTPVSRKEALEQAKGRFDYVWFTGTAPKEDVCAVFRKRRSK